MAKHTNEEVQTALNKAGFGPIDVDGSVGPQTAEAVTKFQTANDLAINGQLDEDTLAKMFPPRTTEEARAPRGIQATVMDWVLNAVTSKINAVAATLAAAVLLWINTKFGLVVSPEVETWVTGGLVMIGTTLIGLFRTFANNPRVTKAKPAVILNPGTFT